MSEKRLPVTGVPTLDGLVAACERAGLSGADLAVSLDLYLRRGTLSRADRAALDGMGDEARLAWIVARYGLRGARVGIVACRGRIGGE